MFVGMGANSGGAYNLESSLRFRRSANAYLSRTPASTGNRKTFTFSLWFKGKGYYTGNDHLIGVNTSSTSYARVYYGTAGDNYLRVNQYVGGVNLDLTTTQVLRDPSAWYHLVVAFDTTQATASNRIKVYLNGEQITSFSTATYPSQNFDTLFNTTNEHRIGTLGATYNTGYEFDGYMTEVNFVDGQALTPSDFGETDTTTGVWKPKEYTGTYGTNGFYLPMKETQQATGFNTVLYSGAGNYFNQITNVGFSPDLVWIKERTSTSSNTLVDTVRGATKLLLSDTTGAETTANALISFESNGFTVGGDGKTNEINQDYVAWCWDAGSSTVSNTDGTITSSVRANPATGFSIVSYTGTGANATVGHGLSSNPHVIIVKNRSAASDWLVYHHENTANPETDFLRLNTTATTTDNNTVWNDTAPTSSVFSIGTAGGVNTSSNNYVAYCFSEVSGYSKFGSYTGNGSVGNSVTGLGFEPAFLLIKNATDLGGSGESWYLYDNARDPVDTRYHKLNPNGSSAESTSTVNNLVDFDSDGFTIQSTNAGLNYNGDTYIYMAFADTRDAQFNFDASGNKNNWTPNNINSNASSETTYDIMNDVATLTDEDTANFATLNAVDLSNSSYTPTNANLTYNITGGNQNNQRGSIAVDSGKWYWECTIQTGGGNALIGVARADLKNDTTINFNSANGWYYYGLTGNKYNSGNQGSYGSTYTTGDVIGFALDMDNGKIWWSKNGTWQASGDPAAGTNAGFTNVSGLVTSNVNNGFGGTLTGDYNYGQRPFKYTPPTGFKKLNTYNLPDSTIKDGSQYMNTVLYTGNSSTNAITGVGFSPDWIWIKRRDSANAHQAYDSVRTLGYVLSTSKTDAESDETDKFVSIDSDGFTIQSNAGSHNLLNATYVAWNWRGSDSSAVSNTDGTITSTVSANTDSGFSVVTWTADTSSPNTIGHGLGQAPQVIISKRRSQTSNWGVYHHSNTSSPETEVIYLNLTNATTDLNNYWNDTAPTSSVFTVGSAYDQSEDVVAYCFAEVEGFSKFGSYTGNGSTDGPFVYTGFRPAFVLFKRTNSTSNWIIFDQTRGLYNLNDNYLYANASGAEGTSASSGVDLLSNGFKQRNTYTDANISGSTYIYMAFAENPFKHSLAR